MELSIGKHMDISHLGLPGLVHHGLVLSHPETRWEFRPKEPVLALLTQEDLVVAKRHANSASYKITSKIPLHRLQMHALTNDPHAPPLPVGFSRKHYAFPIPISAQGKMTTAMNEGDVRFYAKTADAQREWMEKINSALKRISVNDEKTDKLNVMPLDSVYIPPTGYFAQPQLNAVGTIMCGLSVRSPHTGMEYVLLGSEGGIWLRDPNDKYSLNMLVESMDVTQLGFIEEAGLLVVLSENDLSVYKMEGLIPGWKNVNDAAQGVTSYTHTSIAGKIGFFTIARVDGKTLILCERKSFASTSVFRIFELPNRITANQMPRFRVRKDWSVSRSSHGLIPLQNKLAVLSGSSAEILELNKSTGVSLPAEGSLLSAKVQALISVKNSRILGVFVSGEDQYLVCYSDFGVHVDQNGEPIETTSIMEWGFTVNEAICVEGRLHLFSSDCIEIRNVSCPGRCELLKSYQGKNIRYISSPFSPSIDCASGDSMDLDGDSAILDPAPKILFTMLQEEEALPGVYEIPL